MDSILHALGLCGEHHFTALNVIAEWPTVTNVLNYLKTIMWQK